MDGLRPRNREIFIGFTMAETEKMDKLMRELGEQLLEREFCQSTAKNSNSCIGVLCLCSRSAARAGKPAVIWTELQSWFENRVKESPNISRNCPSNKAHKSFEIPKSEEKIPDVSELEFEARSSKDGAWLYDVEKFLAHRFLSTGETRTNTRPSHISSLSDLCHLLREVRVIFVGLGAEEDEWVNVKKAVRERSVPLEHSECYTLKVGDHVLCILERRDEAIHVDSHITDIQRQMHDIRGRRSLFTIRYSPDNCDAGIANPFFFSSHFSIQSRGT
ncbi:sawadee homeodoman 1-like [Pyrus ussuriensis x Pyrus communis]|uniref:Sawadee homeodoman 1-like n=1 Tax=Pyrus ussuriensis x Pyrus communis TaxID=2448454 RepID=A0A5N5HSF8_9ROSA|nr:sawadee homeodoman 1-like [Pyrus ussuriensis x Pyrus communis]